MEVVALVFGGFQGTFHGNSEMLPLAVAEQRLQIACRPELGLIRSVVADLVEGADRGVRLAEDGVAEPSLGVLRSQVRVFSPDISLLRGGICLTFGLGRHFGVDTRHASDEGVD